MSIFDIFRDLFRTEEEPATNNSPMPVFQTESQEIIAGQKPDPVFSRILMIVYNPFIDSQKTTRLSEHKKWNDPDKLANEYIQEMNECSYGYLNYQIVERIIVDGFPVKEDGFEYSVDEFLQCMQTGKGFHQPDTMDYHYLLNNFNIIKRINNDEIDEVWLFGFPYAGFFESRMAGPNAFWCNAPPLANKEPCSRRFVLMGFNYERGVGEMMESMGHRAEWILQQVFRNSYEDANLWERFTRYHLIYPNQAEVGTVHYAPNSLADYDWGNQTPVKSFCDTWYRFPNLKPISRMVNASEWGNGNIREHHRWWFLHFPHVTGHSNNISYNWWEYVSNPNKAV